MQDQACATENTGHLLRPVLLLKRGGVFVVGASALQGDACTDQHLTLLLTLEDGKRSVS